jgi:hypothetical protein
MIVNRRASFFQSRDLKMPMVAWRRQCKTCAKPSFWTTKAHNFVESLRFAHSAWHRLNPRRALSVQFRSILAWVGAAWILSACAENPSHLNTVYLDRYADPNPTPTSVLECHGFSCSETSRATLNRDAWRHVAAVFVPRAKDAATERRQIAHGVALIQVLVGQQTGTAAHQWTHRDKDILPNLSDQTQLDCIDEAVNTWTYLTLMEQRVVTFPSRGEAFLCRLADRPP